MRVLLTVAAFLLASSAAQAQYTFDYGGRTIRIDPDQGTVSIPGVFDNTRKKSKRPHTDQDGARNQTGSNPHTPDQTAPAASAPAPAPDHSAAAPSPAAGSGAPADTAAIPPAPAPAAQAAPPPQVAQQPAPATVANVPPPPAVTVPSPAAATPSSTSESVATAAPRPPAPPAPVQRLQPPAPAPAAVQDANSPAGIWFTEEKEGRVRIEPCGANLCGYAVDAKSNQNGEQVLINMKPGKDQKWSGRIVDPDTGATYDSTIALIGANALRVQGCALGGMFCGGQTWTRAN